MELNNRVSGKIFDIQGFSVHDGPGARSLVFLKGCSLNCFWCSNPEGITHSIVPLYYSSRCIECGHCATACTNNAIHLKAGTHQIDRGFCKKCDDHPCVENCYTDALLMCGRDIDVDELFSIIQRDRQFWGNNGGVTFTGGEPLMQADFISCILEKCYNAYIHTAIETCGHVPWKNFKKTINYLDWIFFDLKHIDSEQHKAGTGYGNEDIINNVMKLNENFNGRVVFRLPFIPGYNSNNENLEGIARLISETKWKEMNILPLHHLGREKYRLSGSEYKGGKYSVPSFNELKHAKAIFEKFDVKCFIGHDTLF